MPAWPRPKSDVVGAAAHADALDFERGYSERAAARAASHPLGVTLRDDAVPRAHMLNLLRVTVHEATPTELTAALDALQGHLLHRAAYVEHDALGHALAAPLREQGFVVERHLYMTLRRGRDRDAGQGLAEEVDEATHAAVETTTTRERPHGGDVEVVRQLAWARAALRAAVATRSFVGSTDGVRAATATLLSRGAVAQLEDVATLTAHRRRGLARAVCSAAVDAALAAGSALVFVVANDDDWPKELYGKLGFEAAGASWAVTRDPA